MKKLMALLFTILLCVPSGWGQAPARQGERPRDFREPLPELQDVPELDDPGDIPDLISVRSGTHVPMIVVRAPQESQAHEGSLVYLRTRAPLAAEGHVVIPARTLVVGELVNSGFAIGPAQVGMSLRLRTIILPNHYRVPLSARVAGTIEAKGSSPAQPPSSPAATIGGLTPAQLAMVSSFAMVGGEMGAALGKSSRSTMVGTLVGAGVGMATALAMNGTRLHLHAGSYVEAVLDEPLALDSRYVR